MSEGWKTLRAYRKWLGWLIVGAFVVLNLRQGWITMADIHSLGDLAVRIIESLAP